MFSGYRVSHPKLDCTYNVVLTKDQYHEVLNHLAEMGEGGTCERMSDLFNCCKADMLINVLRSHY